MSKNIKHEINFLNWNVKEIFKIRALNKFSVPNIIPVYISNCYKLNENRLNNIKNINHRTN